MVSLNHKPIFTLILYTEQAFNWEEQSTENLYKSLVIKIEKIQFLPTTLLKLLIKL